MGAADNYTTYEYDDILTRCPKGTGDDGSDTKNKIEQCLINDVYKLFVGENSIRPAEILDQA